MFLIWRDGEKQAIAIVDSCTLMPMRHELSDSLSAAKMSRHVANTPRQQLLLLAEALRQVEPRGIAVDRHADVPVTNVAVP